MKKVSTIIKTRLGGTKEIFVRLDDEVAESLLASGDEELIHEVVVQEYKIFLNEYKHQRHSISLDEEMENGNDLADESADAEENVIKQDRNTALHKAIKQLEPQQQWLVEQVYFLERTQASIAVELGVSKQAIANRLKKIYEKLKVFLN